MELYKDLFIVLKSILNKQELMFKNYKTELIFFFQLPNSGIELL